MPRSWSLWPTCYTASMLRRLRIVASMFFAIVTVAIAMLWVRSYWSLDQIVHANGVGEVYSASSDQGLVELFNFYEWPNPPSASYWSLQSRLPELQIAGPRFVWDVSSLHHACVIAPHWFLLLFTMVAAGLCWPFLPFRFSLRSMLIATTLVGVAMGLVAYAFR
jgi:hypothetical protein